jgi:hypothetical protein
LHINEDCQHGVANRSSESVYFGSEILLNSVLGIGI